MKLLGLMLKSYLILTLNLFIAFVNGCGITTHIETGERSRRFFDVVSEGVDYNRLLAQHQDAFQAGAPYPDAFYPGICFRGDYHDVAEDSHWTPFIKASVEYIQRHYPRPWSQDAEKLVVFLMGVVQHQVADATWHSLGIEQGFLDTMGKINYRGSFSKAHSDGDFGGDVLNVYQLNMDYVGQIGKWYIPVDDLVNIYTEMYGASNPMTPQIIETCTQLLFLGRLGESIGAIDLLYPLYSGRSPFLLDRLQDYFLGGVDDMAVWTQNVWKRTLYMIDHSTSNCTLPENPIYIRCDYESQQVQGRSAESYLSSSTKHNDRAKAVEKWFNAVSQFADTHSILVERSNKGLTLSASESAMREIKRRQKKSGREISPCHSEDVDPPQSLYLTNVEYSRLGQHITSGDVNNDGYLDAIISAPSYSTSGNYQQGSVYIMYGNAEGIPTGNKLVERDADQILNGVAVNGRFGSSVIVLDINKDGLNDLAVSAPSVGSPTLDYYGRVYIYLSSASSQVLPRQPSITISCTERYCNLGTTLTDGDVDGDGWADLIVGSPYAGAGGRQRGMVGVLYASSDLVADSYLTEADFSWRFDGDQDYQWAGYSVSCDQTKDGGTVLLIGAPSHRICVRPDCQYNDADIQAAGKVFLFSSSQPSKYPLTSPTQTLEGTEAFQQLGAFVNVAQYNKQDVIIITSLTADVLDSDTINGRKWSQAGRVDFFSLLSNHSADVTSPLLTLSGSRDYGRFGAQVLVYEEGSISDGSTTSSILVASPLRSEDFFEDREGGRVYLYTAESLAEHQANRTLGIYSSRSRFGSSMTLFNTHSSSSSPKQLLVGSEHYNRASGVLVNRLVGAVGQFTL